MAKKKIEIMMTDEQAEVLRREMLAKVSTLEADIPGIRAVLEHEQATVAATQDRLARAIAKAAEARETYESAWPQQPPPRT